MCVCVFNVCVGLVCVFNVCVCTYVHEFVGLERGLDVVAVDAQRDAEQHVLGALHHLHNDDGEECIQ